MGHPSTAASRTTDRFQQERAELEAVLEADVLARAPSLARLLNYICQKYFEGLAEGVKEYNIGVEALGRSPDFDTKEDSIVRVEAHRLRKHLAKFYQGPGRHHAVQIRLRPGQYVPQFVRLQPDQQQWEVPWSASSGELLTPDPQSGECVWILAGSSLTRFVDQRGNVWTGDHNFTGGEVFFNPAARILRTADPTIFQNRREGDFSYAIPLRRGTYELRLYFAETVFGPGNIASGGESSRQFNVDVNRHRFLSEFDIVADAGGSNTADVKLLTDVTPDKDGLLHLRFSALKEKAILNAIEILPSQPGEIRPVLLLAGRSSGAAYVDRQGRRWEADQYWMGGQAISRPDPVAGSQDPALYQSERFGNFTYALPVPLSGRYTLTLRFAETWFGPDRMGGGGAGSRVFDVYCNGVSLLRHFDIFKEAGGSYRSIEKTFPRLAPNAQGKLNLAFVPVRNYACINAIEVTSATR